MTPFAAVSPTKLAAAVYAYGVATGDFYGDGWIDFAIANDGVGFITVFPSRNTEAGS